MGVDRGERRGQTRGAPVKLVEVIVFLPVVIFSLRKSARTAGADSLKRTPAGIALAAITGGIADHPKWYCAGIMKNKLITSNNI